MPIGRASAVARLGRVLALGGVLVLTGGCKGGDRDGGASEDAGSGGCPSGEYGCATGCCTCLPVDLPTAITLVEGGGVGQFAAGDFDGDALLDLVLARNLGGVLVFEGAGCGGLRPGPTGLDGVQVTGLDAADLDGTGGADDLLAFGADGRLRALEGADLSERWSASLALPTAGRVVGARLDGDSDEDAVAFDGLLENLLPVATSGGAWMPGAGTMLSAGLLYASAGELGGGPRDELLVTGSGGFYEIVSTGDLAYGDVRTINAGAHGPAAVADFDGNGNPDVLVVSDGMLIRYTGDGATNLSYAETFDLPTNNSGIAIAVIERTGAPPAEAVLLQTGGGVVVVTAAGGPLSVVAQAATNASARRIFAGDLDGDARDDVVTLGLDGVAHVWRTP